MKSLYQSRQLRVLALALLTAPAWAAGIQAPGVPNFHQVDDQVYRGGQPRDEGWKSLAALGVKTVVDLRRADEHSTQAERQAVEAAGMRYVNVPMHGVVAPGEEQISKVMNLLTSKSAGPVFVHCKRGADRTGAVIACYRIAQDGWSKDKALKEAKADGMSWMQFGMRSYVRGYQPPVQSAAAGTERQPATTLP